MQLCPGAIRILVVFCVIATTTAAMVTPVSANVYVSNADGDTVSVIDPATNAVTTTISVGSEPRNLAATPDGRRVYVPNRFSDSVSVISTATDTVIATVTDSSFDEPYAVAVTPDGTEAWVVNKQGGGSSTGSVTIINTVTNTVSTAINDSCFSSPEAIAMNPVQARAYVINRGAGSVCVVNTVTRAVLTSVVVDGEPRFAVVTPDGASVYVARADNNDVAKIRTSDNAVFSIATAGTPRNMAITPSGNKIYVPNQSGDLLIISTASDTVSTLALSGGCSTYGATVVQSGASLLAHVTDECNGQVYVVDTATDTETAASPISDSSFDTPRAIAAAQTSQAVPTLSEWAMILMAALLAVLGWTALRRRMPMTPAA